MMAANEAGGGMGMNARKSPEGRGMRRGGS